MKNINIIIIMECVYCAKDIKRQMELWFYKGDALCSRECKDLYELDNMKNCKICDKKTTSMTNSIYYDGLYFCSQTCYLRELQMRNLKKYDFSYSDNDGEEDDPDIRDLFSTNAETKCKFCNKYMNKSDKEAVYKFGNHYCGIECYQAKFHITSAESPSSDSSSPPFSHSYKNWTIKNWVQDDQPSNALTFWKGLVAKTIDYVKDSKRERK